MRRLLVTGGSGFIGRHVLEHASERFDEVHSVATGIVAPQPGVTWHQGDLLRRGEARRLIAGVRPTHLLHLAWCATPGEFWTTLDNLDWVEASLELGREFIQSGGQRLVGAGTCAEYDWAEGTLREATTPLKPATLYGASKLGTSTILEALCRQNEVGFAWGRVFFVYGPRERPERLVASTIGALLRGKEAPCTEGTQLRDFLYVGDLARAFVELTDSRVSGALNLGSGEAVAVRDVVTAIARACGRPDLLRLGARPLPAHEPELIVADVLRLRRDLGFEAKVNLATGLERTIQYWRASLSQEVSP